MKRLFVFGFSALFGLMVFRVAFGRDPLTVKSFLNILSKLDLDFSGVKEVADYMSQIEITAPFASMENFFETVKNFFIIVISPIFFLGALVSDLGSLFVSILKILYELVGLPFLGTSNPNFGPWTGGGHGGGGGGIR